MSTVLFYFISGHETCNVM